MKTRFKQEGFSSLNDHEKLELLLYYALPRMDTNPIAHELLNTFGSLSAVFDAPLDELCKVNGVSEHTALLIGMIPHFARAYMCDLDKEKLHLYDFHSAGRYFSSRFIGVTNEEIHVAYLDNSLRIIKCIKLCEGKVKVSQVDIRTLVANALSTNAAYAIMAHNHPSGVAIPSGDDLNVTTSIRVALETVSVSFLEHYIIAGEKYIGIVNKRSDSDANMFLKVNG